MSAVLTLALGLLLLEAGFRFILVKGAPCVAPLLLQRLSLVRESLLRLGAHCRLPKGLSAFGRAAQFRAQSFAFGRIPPKAQTETLPMLAILSLSEAAA